MGSAVGSPMGPSTGHQAPKTNVSILGGEGSMLGLTRLPGPPAATRWEPEPLGYQELKSERTELPASRLLEETALGRPRAEDSGTAPGLGWGGLGAAAQGITGQSGEPGLGEPRGPA